MLNLKAWRICAATIILSLANQIELEPFQDPIQISRHISNSSSLQFTYVLSPPLARLPFSSIKSNNSSSSNKYLWMRLVFPLGLITIGGVSYFYFKRQSDRINNLENIESKNQEDSTIINPVDNSSISSNTNITFLFNQKKQHLRPSWNQLKQIQESWEQLESACNELTQILLSLIDREILPETLAREQEKTLQNINSHNFRIAFIGDCSTGKSTIINAILGERIQPVRDIPCSGAIAILKYGQQKRVICRYSNGKEQEIPAWQYKAKAAINKHRDKQENSQLEEIIFENPDLDLCRNGVEIIDSPGLNEHPDPNSIIVKLLSNSNVVIFVTNALQVLTQSERELLEKMKTILEKENRPLNHLFVVVNFLDKIIIETDKQRIEQTVSRFFQQELLFKEDRIHFIAAQSALDAILSGNTNKYIESFFSFTLALETFLATEIISIEAQQKRIEIERIITDSWERLEAQKTQLEAKVGETEENIQIIFNQMGQASQCEREIVSLANDLKQQAFNEANESWRNWIVVLEKRLAKKVENWSCDRNPVFEHKEMITDYVNQFIQDIEKEIDDWGHQEIEDKILLPKLDCLETCIQQELKKIQNNLANFDQQGNTNYALQLDLELDKIRGARGGFLNYLFGGVVGGGVGAGLLLFLELITGPLGLAIAAGVVTAFAGLGIVKIKDQVKQKVFQAGWQKFIEASEELGEKVGETIVVVFDNRVGVATKVVQQTINLWDNLLNEAQQVYREELKQFEEFQNWSNPKQQELKTLRNNVEKILK